MCLQNLISNEASLECLAAHKAALEQNGLNNEELLVFLTKASVEEIADKSGLGHYEKLALVEYHAKNQVADLAGSRETILNLLAPFVAEAEAARMLDCMTTNGLRVRVANLPLVAREVLLALKAVTPVKMERATDAQIADDVQWLRMYEVRSQTSQNMTHSSLYGSRDDFTKTGKWNFPDTPEVQQRLTQVIERFYSRDIGLYMVERQSKAYPFIEDLDIECSKGTEVPTFELEKIIKHRATCLRKLFPTLSEEDFVCHVFSASGYSQAKQSYKISYHFVWEKLIVETPQPSLIRQYTLDQFEEMGKDPNHDVAQVLATLKAAKDDNDWINVFDDATTRPKQGLRMPYCDKKTRMVDEEGNTEFVREHRPACAIGTYAFAFENDVCVSAKIAVDAAERSVSEWVAAGSCRRQEDCELTAWTKPLGYETVTGMNGAVKAACKGGKGASTRGSCTGYASTRGSCVNSSKGKGKGKGSSFGKSSSSEGSGQSPKSASGGSGLDPNEQVTEYRSYRGTAQDFQRWMYQNMKGKAKLTECLRGVIWSPPAENGKVTYEPHNTRVIIETSRANMKAFMAAVEPFTEPMSNHRSSNKVSSSGSGSQAQSASSATGQSSSAKSAKHMIVRRDWKSFAEADSGVDYMALNKGEHIMLENMDDSGWAFGTKFCKDSGKELGSGWFPPSYVMDHQES